MTFFEMKSSKPRKRQWKIAAGTAAGRENGICVFGCVDYTISIFRLSMDMSAEARSAGHFMGNFRVGTSPSFSAAQARISSVLYPATRSATASQEGPERTNS